MAIQSLSRFASGPRLINGEKLNKIFGMATGGTIGVAAEQVPAMNINVLTVGTTTLATGAFLNESFQDTVTAHAGGGQAAAFALTSELNRVTTVATAGDSVRLPASAPGRTIIVANHGANTMQVYGAGTDTIDDVATGTGVAQMAGSVVLYTCYTAGAWYAEGLGTGYSGGLQTMSFAAGLTAHAGGGQAAALQLAASLNQVTTVGSAADSVKLPASAAGLQVVVINNAATNSLQLLGLGTDTINGVASGTGVVVAAGKQATLTCYAAGSWVGLIALA